MSAEGWKRYRLNDLVDEKRGISYGIVQPGTFLESGGVPILKVNNLTEKRTTIGDVYRVSEEIKENINGESRHAFQIHPSAFIAAKVQGLSDGAECRSIS